MGRTEENSPKKWKEIPLKQKITVIGLGSFMVVGILILFKKL
tara:strand:+ start:1391 stop:1516 length:126 start_codon:yes stop_codon:yes gene_type:complete